MRRYTVRVSTVLCLGLGLTWALLWLLAGGLRMAQAQGPDTFSVYYVAVGGNCGGAVPCYDSVQAAVDAVDDPGDVIKVAAGTYTGVQGRAAPADYGNPPASGTITQVVYLSKTLSVQGGYTITNWAESDPEVYPTTLDAQGQGRVLFVSGEVSPTIEGLRLTGGDATGLGGQAVGGGDSGGGVYVSRAMATLRDNVIVGNTAPGLDASGGGMFLWSSDAVVSDNTFSHNAAHYGGGLYAEQSHATIERNTVFANAAINGGGMSVFLGQSTLRYNDVFSNAANWEGGGLYLSQDSSTLSGNEVSLNTAGSGGGVYLVLCDGVLEGNQVLSNTVGAAGGGMYLEASDATLINNVIADNQASAAGSGLYILRSSPQLLHTTIARNGGGDGSGIYVTDQSAVYSSPALTNTIVASQTVGIHVDAGNTAWLESTLWHDNGAHWNGPVNRSNDRVGDPAFVDAGAGDYHIGSSSAAIDGGVDAGVDVDIDGETRPAGTGYDIGADERPDAMRINVDLRVVASSDDAEERAGGYVALSSSDLELVDDGGDIQTVGIRFDGVTLTPGAQVVNAYVQFKVDEASSVATSLTIVGQADDNAPTFLAESGNISSRSTTTASVSWSPPPWTTVGQAGLDQRTPNLSAVVQEVIGRPGWASGNALALIITGSGKRVAESWDGDAADAPLLHVEYILAIEPAIRVAPEAGPGAEFVFTSTNPSSLAGGAAGTGPAPVLVTAPVANSLSDASDVGALVVRLETPAYSITQDAEGFDLARIEDFGLGGLPGEPLLPRKVYHIALPPGATLDSLRLDVVDTQVVQLPGTYQIKPAPVPLPSLGARPADGLPNDVPRGEASEGGTVRLLPAGQMRQWRFARLEFTPFRYDAASGRLTVVSELTAKINYDVDREARDPVPLGDAVMEDAARSLLVNYDAAQEWYRPPSVAEVVPSVVYQYVIVTTNAIEAGSTKLADFVAHKTAQGYGVLVITEDEYGSLTGPAPNGTAEKIREWLKAYYGTYAIEYVLLIGDPDPDDPSQGTDAVGDVPMKMCWPRHGAGNDELAPTDYFFADLTGNWDVDGDQYYGEYDDDYDVTGGVDLAPEVYVGRIPVYDADYAVLDSILQKLISYDNEASTGWRENVLLPMSFSGETTDGAPLAEQMIDDYITPSGYSSWTQYQQGGGACAVDSSYTSDEELRGGTVVRDRWTADPYGVVVWWGHGSTTLAFVGYGGCVDGTLFDSGQASALDNGHPSFTYQNSCNNGYPEYSNNLQYALLKNGGIGTVGATRVSWYTPEQPYGTFDGSMTNAGIGYEYAQRLIQEQQPGGRALYNAKASMTPDSTWWLMNFLDFNYYGDPSSALVRTDPPPTRFTIYNEGNDTLTVTDLVKQSGSTWLTVTSPEPLPFDVAPGGVVRVGVSVDATGLVSGTYTDRILVYSNDTGKSPYPSGDAGDPNGGVDVQFQVSGANQAPELAGLPEQVFGPGTPPTSTVDLWAYAWDDYSPVDELTFALEGTPPAGAGVTLIDNRYLHVEPSFAWCGWTDVTIRVTDPGGLWSTGTLKITVNTASQAVAAGDAPPVDMGCLALDCAAGPGGTVTVTLYHTNHPNLPNGVGVMSGYREIESDFEGAYTCGLTFTYDEDDLNGATESDIAGAARWTDENVLWEYLGGTVDTVANKVTLADVSAFSPWLILTSTPPQAVSDLGGTRSGVDVQLVWSAVTQDILGNAVTLDHYVVYRRADEPYFSPDAGDIIATPSTPSFTDPGILGDPAHNYYYVVTAVDGAGVESAPSNRLGAFDQALTPAALISERAYNLIALNLRVPGVTDADSLAAYVGGGAYMVLRHDAATQGIEWRLPGLAGTNFPVAVGDVVFLSLDDTAPGVVSLVGDVPSIGEVGFALARPDPGGSCAYNFISVPLHRDDLVDADALAADIGGVYTISRYNAETQDMTWRMPGVSGENFPVRAGYPYIVCLDETAPPEWP